MMPLNILVLCSFLPSIIAVRLADLNLLGLSTTINTLKHRSSKFTWPLRHLFHPEILLPPALLLMPRKLTPRTKSTTDCHLQT